MSVAEHKTSRTTAHMVVRASAGTGKTFMLSNRYLRLLRDGAGPDQILAMTFTRKAAGEILQRVLMRLARAAQHEAAAAQLGLELQDVEIDLGAVHQMLGRVIRSLHCVSISTIDSFFNRMVQCIRFELGLPSGMTLVDEGDATAQYLRQAAIEALLADRKPAVVLDLLRRLHHDTAQRAVSNALNETVSALHEVYRQTTAEAWSQLPVPQQLSATQLDHATDILGSVVSSNAIKNFAKALARNHNAAVNRDWHGFVSQGLTKKIISSQDSPHFRRRPIPEGVVDAYEPLIAHARAVLVGQVARQTEGTFELLERFDSQFSRLRRQHRLLLFSDLPYALSHQLTGLGREAQAAVHQRLDTHVAHLLLDEFQDTSAQQWQVLKPFADQICGGSDGSGTFFCVGDVKQAIYGWRGGCAQIFEQVECDLGLSNVRGRTLLASRRCSQVVLDVVNRAFGNLADIPPLAAMREPLSDWQGGFERHAAYHQDRPGYVELRASSCVADDPDENEAQTTASGPTPHEQFVARSVAELAQRAAGQSIALLVRTNAAVQRLIYLLRQQEVSASGEGGTPLTDDPAVEVVLSALTLADHPGHGAAAFHVLHSPLAPVIGLESSKKDHVVAIGRAIRLALMNHGYAALIAEWTRRLAPACDRRGIERLTQLIELADQYDPTVRLRVRDFVDYIEAAVVEEPRAAPIRVMTIHKAKGLEFDVVVLAELEKLIAQVHNLPVWTYRPRATEPPVAVFRSTNKNVRALLEEHCPMVSGAYRQELGRRLHDDLSALYVAMTRPRHALYMLVEPLKLKKDGTLEKAGLHNQSYAALLRHALTDTSAPSLEGKLFAHGDPDWSARVAPSVPIHAAQETAVEPVRICLARRDGASIRSWRQVSPSAMESAGRVDASTLLALEPSPARLRGSVIHAWFAQITWLNEPDPVPSEESLRQIARELAPKQSEQWLAEQLESFRAMLRCPAVRETLMKPNDRPGVQLWRERPFLVRTADHLLRGVFDRVVLHRRGARVAHAQIIDYKTDMVPDGPQVPDELIDTYRPQMNAYGQALSRMVQLESKLIVTRLLFVSTGAAVNLLHC